MDFIDEKNLSAGIELSFQRK